MRGRIGAALLAALTIPGEMPMAREGESDTSDIREIAVRVTDSMAEYRFRNGMTDEPVDTLDDHGLDFTSARNGHPGDPDGIRFSYASGTCPVMLPPGRLLSVNYNAGHVYSATMLVPLDPLAFEAIQAMAQELVDAFRDAGWRQTSLSLPLTPEAFLDKTGSKWAEVARFAECDAPDTEAVIVAKHYNSTPPGSAMPPAPLSAPLPDDAPDRFLLQVRFAGGVRELGFELSDLARARRLAVHGDEKKALPLSVWLNDPDWRPEGWDGQYLP